MEKIKVLYVSHERDRPLGSTLSLLNLIRSVREQVEPIVWLPKEGACYELFRQNGIECIVLPFKSITTRSRAFFPSIFIYPVRFLKYYLANQKAIPKMYYLLKDRGIQIVHANTSIVDVGFFLAKKLKAKHVWHLREYIDLDFHLKLLIGWKVLISYIQASDAVIAISRAIQAHFKCNALPYAYCLYDAVRSVKDISYDKEKEKYFLVCGNIHFSKGQELAVKSFNLFVRIHPDYRLIIVGGGDPNYINHLKKIASYHVEFVGYKQDPSPYYKKASALLMCSKSEGMGRTTIEAMFYGCPVIGYRGGETMKMIEDGKTGLLFQTENECSSRMDYIIKNKENVEAMILKAQSKLRVYTETNYGQSILNIYNKILGV